MSHILKLFVRQLLGFIQLLLLLLFDLSLDGNFSLLLLFPKATLTAALHSLLPALESRTEHGIQILLLLLSFSLKELVDLSDTLLVICH